MLRLTLAAGILAASFADASAQKLINGKGQTCTAVNKRCYSLGGNQGLCEPKFQQCLQTGTFYGNNNTITNLKKQ